ncbi:vesicle-associated membrane protein 1 isoform X1 [Accipiter gentilis]|uniref:vesicle-associated membrane protein 1 isoform X1 n=1 Tax=Astur gentilis TaxID=8957 RepID=UPI00210F6F57|nr:vesicle-associated membrane protein 1 isoform X1 [Accipiter gentilis]
MSDPAQQPAPEAPEGGAPGGAPPGQATNVSSNRRLQQTQAQMKEVVDIMCVNVDKVLQRDEKLSELDDRADALQAGASQFESSAAKLKRKYWWKNCKMMIMMGVIGAIVVAVIVRSLNPESNSPLVLGHTFRIQMKTSKSSSQHILEHGWNKGCKAVLPVACGSHTINPCPVLNIIKIMPEQCMVNGGFAAVQPG